MSVCKKCGSDKIEIVAEFIDNESHYVKCGECKRKGPEGMDAMDALKKWDEENEAKESK